MSDDGVAWLPGERRDLAWLPMAARRALDRAGIKLSLSEWQAMAPRGRLALARLGSAADVDVAAVRRLDLRGSERPVTLDPDPAQVPAAVRAAIPTLSAAAWSELDPVTRHALDVYARRGRPGRAAELYRQARERTET